MAFAGASVNAPPAALDDKRFTACVALIGKTGATQFQIRVSDAPEPDMWIAAAEYVEEGKSKWLLAAGLDPLRAVFGLCEELVDGGMCVHCEKTTAITLLFGEAMPMRDQVCWRQYDPELATFRRSCE